MIYPTDKVMTLEKAAQWRSEKREAGESVVFANGCFDLLHGGHVSYLEGARLEGDSMIVAINSDASVRGLKGEGRPVVPELERAELLGGMSTVDAVVIFEEPDCERLLRELRPDVHAKGTDYTTETVPEREIARELGIRVAIVGAPKENNSKDIIKSVQAEQV